MARMIPAFFDDNTPPGEQALFNFLASAPDDWVAIHSLDLAPWRNRRRTELDFMLVIPDTGILCIEVKSHKDISFDGERWCPASLTRSPFKQALDARYAFQRRMVEAMPVLDRLPVAHCCIFPYSAFTIEQNMSVQPWELLDGPGFWACRDGLGLGARLKYMLRQSIHADPALEPLKVPLSRESIQRLVRFCLPIQRRSVSGPAEAAHREWQTEKVLRAQQLPIMQLTLDNARVIVTGGAGTGKTLIAMEVARRAAQRGERVGLVCFNSLIGEWLKTSIAADDSAPPQLVVDSVSRLLADMLDVAIPSNPSEDFWQAEFLDLLEERLTDPLIAADAMFDVLVVDEAQDLLARPRLFACLTQLLVGGTSEGSFVLFGDFDNQVLAKRELAARGLIELRAASLATMWRLRENCRNYRLVGETAIALSGADPDLYDAFLRSDGSQNAYDIAFYRDRVDQEARLKVALSDFHERGVPATDIVILSFCAPEVSCAAELARSGMPLRPIWRSGSGTAFTSVSAYKGMESKVVIITDVVLEGEAYQRSLFYIGMTRATESVYVLCDERSKGQLRSLRRESGSE